MKAFTLTAALVAILALGVNGRGAGRGDPSSGDSGEIDEPGCCYGSDVKCQIPDTKATCDKQARKGCGWISGDDADCTPPTAEPGCCAGGGVCEDADNDYCVNNRGAKKAGCAWIGGEDADCAPLPGCCYGTSSVCWDATQSSCASRTAKKAGCAWIEGTTDAPPDCTPPTPEPGCCAGEGVCEDADNDYCVNNRMAKKAGCEWLSGKDANCETTTTSTPATTGTTHGDPTTTQWGGPVTTHGDPTTTLGGPVTTHGDAPICETGLLMTGWVDSGDVESAQLNDEYEYGAMGPSGYPWYVGSHNGYVMFVDTEFMNVHISVSFKTDPMAWCSGTDIAACTVGQWFHIVEGQWSADSNAGLVDCMPTTTTHGDPMTTQWGGPVTTHGDVTTNKPSTNWCNGEYGVDGCGTGGDYPRDCGICDTLDGREMVATTDRPDAYSCGVCDEAGCCLGNPDGSYWYRCDPRAGAIANPGWTDWSTVKENCEINAGYGCTYVAGASVENGQCKLYEDQFDGCCVKGDPTNTWDWTDQSDFDFFGIDGAGGDDCAFVSELWGKDVCLSWGGLQRGCEWRAGASGDKCTPNQVISCNNQYDADCINGGSGVSEYMVSCNADSSCRGADLIASSNNLDCRGFKSCADSALDAGANIDCGGEESCTGASIEAGDTVTCGGLHSCSSIASLSTGKLSCLGEEGCAGNENEVHATKSAVCSGQKSCADMSALVSATIACNGRDSCMGSTLLAASVSCSGKQACQEAIFGYDDFESGVVQSVTVSGFKGAADATLYNVGEVRATGATSLSGAQVRTNTGSTTVILSGRQSGKNAIVSCEGDAQCTVLCNDEACAGLAVFVLGGANVVFGMGTNADSFTEIDCFSNPGGVVDRTTCPMIAMSDADMKLKAKSQMSPVALSADLRADTAAYVCDEANECAAQTFNGGDFAECAGYRGCYDAMFDDVSGLECTGLESCASSNLVHGTAQCRGYESCEGLDISSTGDVSLACSGSRSCYSFGKDGSWSDRSDPTGTQSVSCSGYYSCVSDSALEIADSCAGSHSCYGNIVDMARGFECGGEDSCYMIWLYDQDSDDNDVDCSGYQSCNSARLFKQDALYCGGGESCRSARIYGPNALYALGQDAMKSAMIHSCHTQGCDTNPGPSIRDITIYAYGSGAMSGSTLRCYSGATCDVLCHGDACTQFNYDCYDGATCNCVGDSCPKMTMKQMEMEAAEVVMAVGVDLEMDVKPVVNEQLVLLVGAGAVVSILAGVYYIFGGAKNKVSAPWDDEE